MEIYAPRFPSIGKRSLRVFAQQADDSENENGCAERNVRSHEHGICWNEGLADEEPSPTKDEKVGRR